jgi:hypothetical protein
VRYGSGSAAVSDPRRAIRRYVDVVPCRRGVRVVERSEPAPFGKAGSGDDAATTDAVAVGWLRVATVLAVVSGKVHEDRSSVVANGAFLSAMGI